MVLKLGCGLYSVFFLEPEAVRKGPEMKLKSWVVANIRVRLILEVLRYSKCFQCKIYCVICPNEYPFTKTTNSHNGHFWLSPLGGRIRESLLYIKGKLAHNFMISH